MSRLTRRVRRWRSLPRRVSRLESHLRLTVREQDLVDTAFADAIDDLHANLTDIRARLAEWEISRAEHARKNET